MDILSKGINGLRAMLVTTNLDGAPRFTNPGTKNLERCNVRHYTQAMIKTFAHKGLERFFLTGSKRGIITQHAARIERLLDRLEASVEAADMNLPGYRFHELTGKRKGTYSVTVSGNWRITFAFRQGNAYDVNLEDYH